MSLSVNLKQLMARHGNMSVSELARATQLPQPTLHQLYVGLTEKPRKNTLATLAAFFSVSPEQLLGLEPLPDQLPARIKAQFNICTIPIISWDELALWPDKINLEGRQEIILDEKQPDTTFAVHAAGSTLGPLFPDTCLLLFDTGKKPKDRDYVILYHKVQKQFSYKRVLIDGHLMYCKSIHPELHDLAIMPLSKDEEIMATLLEARIKF